MIRISNIKIPVGKVISQQEEDQIKAVKNWIVHKYRMKESDITSVKLIKRSLDARKKQEIHYIYSVDVKIAEEKRYIGKPNITETPKSRYVNPVFGTKAIANRPIVVGMGPAGLFCALELAKAGYCPLVLERGEDVENRVKSVETFWKTKILNTESNVQFGEGGAGTFSDGKLNTLVKDPFGRHQRVLDTFVAFGAPHEITYINKPHIGTDRLRYVVKAIREEIIRLGGEVRFQSKVTDIQLEHNQLKSIEVNGNEIIPCEIMVLAIGHSARDTFEMIQRHNVCMEAKAFAIGIRIEHKQSTIGKSQYGDIYDKLPAADYKLTHKCQNQRGIYSFCMCPGGFVVNASSEDGRLAVNGMSNYDRAEVNANSAMIVTVTPEDFDGQDCLAGMKFQRKWEEEAYKEGNGCIPVQRFGDFKDNQKTQALGSIEPNVKGNYELANLRNCLPTYVSESIIEGVEAFDKKIKGFSNPDAILSGVETRTSSPVRIVREEETLESRNCEGVFPCGEGAGYAGGIVSAAMDGIKVFEKIATKFKPMKN